MTPPVCRSCGTADGIRVRRILGEDDGRKALIVWCETCDACVPFEDVEAVALTADDIAWLADAENETVQ